MTDYAKWLEANDSYLAETLAWLRQRLEQCAKNGESAVLPSPAVQPVAVVAEAQRKPSMFDRLFRKEDAASPVQINPAQIETKPREMLAAPTASPASAAESGELPPALVLLSKRLRLSDFERNVLLLCAGMELDTRMAGLCARAQQDSNRPYPTFALALALFEQPAWEVMSPERPLRYWRLIEINQPAARPLITSALKADERIVNYLKGLNYLDDRLAALMTPVAGDLEALPPSQRRIADSVMEQLQRPERDPRPPVFQLIGGDTQSKLAIARQASIALGLGLYRTAADTIPPQGADHETLLRLWQRENALLPIALYIDATQVEHVAGGHAGAVQRWVSRAGGVVFFDTYEPWNDLSRDAIALDVAKPTPAEQYQAWTSLLGGAGKEHAARIAGHFSFNLDSIAHIARAGIANETDPAKQGETLWDACLHRSRPAVDHLAQRLDAKAGWDDLQLPAQEKSLLRQIADQVANRRVVYDDFGFRERMNRGLGVSALFAGASGTGKTMAAEVIAKELNVPLFRIDLSAVVSKYIGETNKHMRQLCDAAEDGGGILFFDEADALFGKRSEVKESLDRYANIEINYLLQRIESYRGLAILATNMKSALDTAFLRRLRFIVNFPFPGPAERRVIWEKVFPPRTPQRNIDFERLARLNLTGASIHSIALNAAFLAARASIPVSMQLVLEAARQEFQKLEKPVNEAEFRGLELAGAGR
jgi:hypothetical protein